MKKSAILFVFFHLASYSANCQFFSGDCGGGRNIVPIEDINLCNDSQWVLVFEDNFDGDSLDRGKWKNRSDQQGSLETDNEQHYSTLDNAIVDDGILKITAKRERVYERIVSWRADEDVLGDGLQNLRWHDFTTAYIYSLEKFGYGYFEARCKIPDGQGFWPAMWMYGEHVGDADHKIPSEIDVFEFWDDKPKLQRTNIHYEGNSCGKSKRGDDYSKGFHTFSMLWEPAQIEWWVDGELIRRYSRYTQNGADVGCWLNAWQLYQEAPYPTKPLTLILNLAIDNREGQKPTSSTPFPSTFEIDYVRYFVRDSVSIQQSRSSFCSVAYPIPSSGQLTIELDKELSSPVVLRVLSLQSDVLFEKDLVDNITNIDISFLENGIYFLQVLDPITLEMNFHRIVKSK